MSQTILVRRRDPVQTQSFAWGSLTWLASRALGNTTEMTVGCCILKPGQGNPRHQHPNCSEILVVMQGRIRHTLAEGIDTELEEGDTITIPCRTWHCATNIGSTEARLFIAFSSADRQTVGEEVGS